MFSTVARRFDVPPNKLYAAKLALEKAGRPLIDLVSGNVTAEGIRFPESLLRRSMGQALTGTRTYRPHPLGALPARQVIARWYRAQHVAVPPEQILLTPGTSLSYLYAFQLLADPNDEILFPQPSYPLFDSIAALCGIRMGHYRLTEGSRWAIDFASLEAAIGPRTRAIVLISPHNPTGAVATEAEVRRLTALARQRDLAIISDEVFCPFLHQAGGYARPAVNEAPLILTLNGFSKMLALPGLKLGWMVVTGDAARVRQALRALEVISDTFLPVSDVIQGAVSTLISGSAGFQKSYQRTIRERVAHGLDLLAGSSAFSFVRPEGGFYVTLKLSGGKDEEARALQLLQADGILAYPGFFFDLEGSHLVVSLIHRPATLRRALSRLRKRLES